MSIQAKSSHYSITELLKFKIHGFPTTPSGVRYIIKRDGWKKAVYGRYHVPPDILDKINQIATLNQVNTDGYTLSEILAKRIPHLPRSYTGLQTLARRNKWQRIDRNRWRVPGLILDLMEGKQLPENLYTLNQLADLKLPGFSSTPSGWKDYATRHQWVAAEIPNYYYVPEAILETFKNRKNDQPGKTYALKDLVAMKIKGLPKSYNGMAAFAHRHHWQKSTPYGQWLVPDHIEALIQNPDGPLPPELMKKPVRKKRSAQPAKPKLGMTLDDIKRMNIRGYPKSKPGLSLAIKRDGWERVAHGKYKPPSTFKNTMRDQEFTVKELLNLRLRCLPNQYSELLASIKASNWEPGLIKKTYRAPQFVLDAIQAKDVRKPWEHYVKQGSNPKTPLFPPVPAPVPTIQIARERNYSSKAKFLRMRNSVPIRYLDDHFDPIMDGDRLLRHLNPPMTFSSSWIKNEFGCATGDIALARMPDASLEPMIKRGSIILIQYSITNLDHGKCYAFRLQGYPSVKLVDIDSNNRITLKSLNPSVPDIAFAELDQSKVTLLGQVVWVGAKL